MSADDHLQGARAEVVAQVELLGTDRLISALSEVVDNNEDYVVNWFDAQWDDLEADEVVGWSVDRLAVVSDTTVFVALELELATYPHDDEHPPGSVTTVSALARVTLGPTFVADHFAVDPNDFPPIVASDAAHNPKTQ